MLKCGFVRVLVFVLPASSERKDMCLGCPLEGGKTCHSKPTSVTPILEQVFLNPGPD